MITDSRINAKGELEGKYIPPAKWEEMYTKEEVIALLTDIQLEIELYHLDIKSTEFDNGYNMGLGCSFSKIQERIDALKEYTDD